jgi:hypothetical protein
VATVRAIALKTNDETRADDADANSPARSAAEKTCVPADEEVRFEELAAVLEFDQGLSRAEAETRAAEEVAAKSLEEGPTMRGEDDHHG